MSNIPNKRKSREQKFFEFFKTIQLEYIVAELRYKIYPECDPRRDKSLDIMRAKKDKVIDIAIRNGYNTIFEDILVGDKQYFDPILKKELYSLVYTKPYPTFIYRDDLHRKQLEVHDFKNYYRYGEEFETPNGNGILTSMKDGVCSVRIGEETFTFLSKNIIRILLYK